VATARALWRACVSAACAWRRRTAASRAVGHGRGRIAVAHAVGPFAGRGGHSLVDAVATCEPPLHSAVARLRPTLGFAEPVGEEGLRPLEGMCAASEWPPRPDEALRRVAGRCAARGVQRTIVALSM